ncbi:MAG: aminoacyl-tRNA hydrolase [Gammaproteobacteria bacterium]|nr:aminoacyl-tRNA hydrolase [Gammaproteobacteria bacterium]
MLRITHKIRIHEKELEEHFVRASGPGGQNVNKVATAVQLRFDVENSPSLPPKIRQRLKYLAGKRLTTEGILIIVGRRYRTQERNREDARQRLVALIRQAAVKSKPRIPTKPTRAAKKRRLASKTKRGKDKKLRRRIHSQDE